MEKFVPYEKLSKKKQQQVNKEKRGTWGDLNPATRKPVNSRAYNRKRAQVWKKDLPDLRSFFRVKNTVCYRIGKRGEITMNNNELHFPGTLKSRPILLSDLGTDNCSIHAMYSFKQSLDNEEIKKALDNVLRLACDALCTTCIDLGIDPDMLDYWDGKNDYIVTPFDPSIQKAK